MLPLQQTLQNLFRASSRKARQKRGERRNAAAEILENRALLTTLTVNSAADNLTAGDNLVTLREAIIAANADSTTDLGHTGSGADIIRFDGSLAGKTITLGGTQLAITDALTISGPGAANLTIDGAGLSRVFLVAPGVSADLSGLNITGGYLVHKVGAGIYNDGGTLTVSDSTISGNSVGVGNGGGGIGKGGGTLTVSNSTISGNHADLGGGIFNTVTISNSTITRGTVTISNSTISGNTAEYGGGIGITVGTVTVINSTISSNLAHKDGGGILTGSDAGTLTVNNSTISGNSALGEGGGILHAAQYDDGALIVNNTIVTNSTGGDLSNFGINVSGSNNLSDLATFPGRIGPVTGLDANLADNGGPTLTHALLPGSNAINAGNNGLLPADDGNTTEPIPFDQRGVGFDRIRGGNVDIGAYEMQFDAQYSIDMTITGADTAGNGYIDHAGDVIDYQIVVTNDGAVDLTGVSVTDPLLQGPNGTFSSPVESLNADGVLEAGETWTWTGSYTVQQADFDDNGGGDGDIDNTATVSSEQLPDESSGTAQNLIFNEPPIAFPQTVTMNSNTEILITLSGDDGDPDLSQILLYTIDSLLDNGTLYHAVPPTRLEREYSRGAAFTTDGEGLGLSVGIPVDRVFFVPDPDEFGNPYTSFTFSVFEILTPGPLASDPAPVTIIVNNPRYSIDTTITGVDTAGNGYIDNAGELIDYQIVVTTDGDVDLTRVSVTDPLLQGPNGTFSSPVESLNADGVLEVGETWTWTGSYIVQQADFDNNGGGDGDIDNTATVSSDQLPDESSSIARNLVFNEPPIAFPQTATTDEDTDLNVVLSGDDGNPEVIQGLSFTIESLPDEGALYQTSDGSTRGAAITAPGTTVTDTQHRVIFVPAPDEFGNPYGTFTFTVTDDDTLNRSALTSAAATVTIFVAPVNDVPTIPVDSDDARVDEVNEGAAQGTAVGITAHSDDVDGDPVTYSLTDSAGGRFAIDPTTGVVSVADSTLLDGDATHTIKVQASDDQGGTSPIKEFEITVHNVAPVAADDSFGFLEDDLNRVLDLLVNDSDPAGANDPLSITSIDDAQTTGTVTLSNGEVSYSPDGFFEALAEGDTALDTFAYTISDDEGATHTATVTVTVTGQNDAPTVTGTIADVQVNQNAADTVIDLAGIFADVDLGDVVTISAASSNAGIVAASVSENSLTLDYQANQNGTITVTVTGTDSHGAAVDTSFQVTVHSPVNQVANILATIERSHARGDLTGGQANALTTKLNNALAKIDTLPKTSKSRNNGSSNLTAAVKQIEAFKYQVRALVRSGQLSSDIGDLLTLLADDLIDSLFV